MKIKEYLITLFVLAAVIISIFFPFFQKGLIPFPGNYLLAWYEPWKSDFFANGAITIAHKAIADDTFRQIYPFKILASEMFRNFELPLWNPYNGAGMPLMATMHIGFITPLNLLFIFLPGYLAWTIYIAIQPLLIGFFTYLYCRKINLTKIASIFSSLTFTLSGFVITRLIFGEYIYTFSMLPLLLYLLESYLQDNNSKKILFIPLTILFLFISGQPQIILYVLGFSLFYILWRYKSISNYKSLASLILMFIIGLGLSAVQLLPTYELFRQANINSLSSSFIFNRFLLPPQHLISILIPNYFGNQATYNYWGAGDYIESVASLGIVPCFFAYLSFIKINKEKIKLQLFFLLTTIISILLTLDYFGTRFIFSLPIPIISTGIPSRIFSLTTFSLAILSGYGFDQWLTFKNETKKIIKGISPFIFLILIIFVATFILYKLNISCNNQFVLNCRAVALRNTVLELIVFIFSLFIFFIYILNNNKFIKKILPSTMIILIAIIGIYNSNKFLPFSDKKTILPTNNLINYLQQKTFYDRVFGIGTANIKTDFATFFHFYDPNFYDPLYNRRYGELIAFSNTGKVSAVLPRSDVEIINDATVSATLEKRRERLFALLSVNYLIFKKSEISKNNHKTLWEDGNWYVVNNPTLSRAYAVSNYKVIKNDNQILAELFNPNFNPSQNVILEEKPTLKFENEELQQNIQIKKDSGNRLSIDAQVNQNSILVLTDNYYPGWKALVDGKETKIYRANYTLRAIQLPGGNHKVEFVFQSESLKIGAVISVTSLFLLLLIILRRRKG